MESLTLYDEKKDKVLPDISKFISNNNPVLPPDPYEISTSDSGSTAIPSAGLDVNDFDFDMEDKFQDIPDSCESDNTQGTIHFCQ